MTMVRLPWPAASASAAIVARTKGDEDKIMSGLARLSEEDLDLLDAIETRSPTRCSSMVSVTSTSTSPSSA